MLLYRQSEIRKAYESIFDRKPTKEEIAFWIQKEAQRNEVENFLSISPERQKLIQKIFRDALGREVTTEENELYKRDTLDTLRDRVFRSKERMDVIRGVYLEMVGRGTNNNELFFHIESRTLLYSLRDSLNNSSERRSAIYKTYQEIVKRNPTDDEVNYALLKQTPIVEIRVKLHNE